MNRVTKRVPLPHAFTNSRVKLLFFYRSERYFSNGCDFRRGPNLFVRQ